MMALVIALSVAMLPTAGSAAFMLGSTASGVTDTESAQMVDMTDMAMPADMSMATHDCCPDHAKAKPGDRSCDQCPMASCTVQLLSIAHAAQLNFPILAGRRLPFPQDQVVSLHSGAPPFRPPRV
jgi:hypothetical protein